MRSNVRRAIVNASESNATRRIMVLYYAATAVFLVLDYAAGINVRLAFLDTLPALRAAYYGVCFGCLALMTWRPAWTVFVAAFESLVTLSALIISMGVRIMVVTDQMIETGRGFVSFQEIVNFILAGGIAYIAWVKGLNQLKREIAQ